MKTVVENYDSSESGTERQFKMAVQLLGVNYYYFNAYSILHKPIKIASQTFFFFSVKLSKPFLVVVQLAPPKKARTQVEHRLLSDVPQRNN